MRLLGMLTLVGVLAAATSPAQAEDSCPVPEGASPALASVEPARRLSYVTGALTEAGEKSDSWGRFWRVTFQAGAVVQFAMAGVAKRDADRIDLLAGGAKSLVGAVFAYVARLPAERHHPAWADHPWEKGDLCTRLAQAELALEKDAKFEQRARGIGMHALGLTFNIGVGVAAYLMHHRLSTVASSVVIGGIIGETRIFTTPTVATAALTDYRAAKLDSSKVAFTPLLLPQPGGGHLLLSWTF